jgi:hypothetical protein
MTNHDYLILGMVAVWIVINFLGVVFIRERFYSNRKELAWTIIIGLLVVTAVVAVVAVGVLNNALMESSRVFP